MEEVMILPFYQSYNSKVLPVSRPDPAGFLCSGCGDPIASEMEYVIMEHHDDSCLVRLIMHKKCGELASEIHHPSHPHHPLCLMDFRSSLCRCDLCGRRLHDLLGYRCGRCNFNIDVVCEKVCIEVLAEERREWQHPSHPRHPLTLMRKPPFLFRCDGCGDEDVDMAYICSTCEFWVHKSCALSPTILECGRHRHHHPLSLAFSFPEKHSKHAYKCDVCDKYIGRVFWVYYCGDCRYFVHIKCVFGSSTTKPADSNLNEDVVEFPLSANDIFDKLITPFVMRQTGLDHIPEATSSSFVFKYHEHPLSLVSDFTHKDEQYEEEEEEGLKICDVCVTPISNSTLYYQCTTYHCTYSIHSICSLLPHTLRYSSSSSSSSSSSNPNSLLLIGECKEIPNKNHNFTLYKSEGRDAISFWSCNFCNIPTNGLGYECRDCREKIDVKCVSLPTTIRHASHTRRHNKPLIFTGIPRVDAKRKTCHGCNGGFNYFGINYAYCCSHDGCDFALHLRCALLPLSVTNREWDKHPLMLTFDASCDHPSDFFCEFCEEEMHPKKWMYHCRECDASFHLQCLKAGSGEYKNMKLGGRYEMDGIHHPNHPLTFTCVTLKTHCDVCHKKKYVYARFGFECASCYYVMCCNCGVKELGRKN